jgi:hypothetical protein
MLKKPNVYGSIFRFEGMASVFAQPFAVKGWGKTPVLSEAKDHQAD